MSTKTVPFSARISVEDAEFISSLEYDGAHTPSDKLRALLAETRRRHQGFTDYGQNLAQMQEWLGQIKRQLLVRQQQLNQHSELMIRLLDALPDLLATLQTLAASCSSLNSRELQHTEQQVLLKLCRLNELLLPLALTADADSVLQQGVFGLAKLIHQHKLAIQGEPQ
ncbi:hypothetical protein MN202_08550 [Rheinheimera muenzenbergensis]|uniref:Uncharacterized protein n=1 Tax=Rheinheimera muenzenbergensis TaxID=1193628 RepID=A0ABU8C5T8_9GAMM|nr:hypothetical protein [Gammaproteobacteria bacterium]MBU1554366.1 hypothetical protein [Gammaproteobacteria bacterium]MBU2069501.1 hypothetical protein [Gammaproteobacteria bacterium]MBU2183005.1 hypothetical protein [Gammaproteobacteria bacterium]MBU2206650.1 hypothetical protein [Gammaproteobacteria bacterium]